MVDGAAWDLMQVEAKALADLDEYCGFICGDTADCPTCPIARAKARLAWSHLETRVPGYAGDMTPRELRETFQALPGGKR